MLPRQESRGPGRRKRPRDEVQLPRGNPTSGFAAVNSPPPGSDRSRSEGQPSQSSLHPIASQPLGMGTQAPPGKVAIPALKNPRIADSKALKKGRTPHACDLCRKAKAGCTGGNPCTRCKNANLPCVYGDGKRDKDRKKLSKLSKESISLNQHNYDVTEALRRIRLDTKLSTEDIRAALDDVISMAPTPVIHEENNDEDPALASRESSEAGEETVSGNEDLEMEVGSTGSLDVINVNTDRDDTRATGHMGKSSSVAWAKRTADECQPNTNTPPAIGKHQTGFVLASYHTEDVDVEFFDTSNVNCFDWPDSELADALVASYFERVHKVFPIVDKLDFMYRYKRFVRGSVDLSVEDVIWLGALNMIFAISAVYAHLTKGPNRGHYGDHLIYLARAKILCLDQGLLYEDARVLTTSALGLLCLYFITTCRLNRAWTICGLAIRHALTLGLHVRSEADDLSDSDKEHRVRLWWSLYSLECLLNELTGRPSCISDRDISTPLPINMNEDDLRPGQALYDQVEKISTSRPSSRRSSHSSKTTRRRPSATYQMPIGILQPLAYTFPVLTLPATSSTYFIYRTQLCIVSHEIITQLYCAATIKEKWVEVQQTIRRIDGRLRAWRDNLPPEFNITFDRWDEPDWSDPQVLPRMGLAMLFNSSRMILFRPTLCRFEGRMASQSEKSKDFNREAVEMCIHSARTMISLIGWSARSVEKLYAITPWWHTLHYLCEALSVLMLELAYQAQHLPSEAAYILDDAKKGIRWLVMMSGESISARKAWEIFDSLVRVVAPMINWSVFDLPTTAPIPPGYNWRRWSNSEQQASSSSFASQQQMSHPPPTLGMQYPDPDLIGLRTQSSPSSDSPWRPQNTFAFDPMASSTIPGTYAAHTYGQELAASNPLDQSTAVQMFGSIGGVHGHFDEPWQHMFTISEPGSMSSSVAGIQGDGVMSMGPPPAPGDVGGEKQGAGTFGTGAGAGFDGEVWGI